MPSPIRGQSATDIGHTAERNRVLEESATFTLEHRRIPLTDFTQDADGMNDRWRRRRPIDTAMHGCLPRPGCTHGNDLERISRGEVERRSRSFELSGKRHVRNETVKEESGRRARLDPRRIE